MTGVLLRSTIGLRRPQPRLSKCGTIGGAKWYVTELDPNSWLLPSGLRPKPVDRRPWWVKILNRIGVTI